MLCVYKKEYKYVAKCKLTKSIEMFKSLRIHFQSAGMCFKSTKRAWYWELGMHSETVPMCFKPIEMHSGSMQLYVEGRRIYFESIPNRIRNRNLGPHKYIWYVYEFCCISSYYRISSNKHPLRLLNFEAFRCSAN